MKREDRVVESQSNLDFSQTLQVVRVNFGKSQRELANFMGVSKTTLARLEKKTLAALSIQEISNVTTALNLDPEKVLASLLNYNRREQILRSNLKTSEDLHSFTNVRISYAVPKNPFIKIQYIEISPYGEIISNKLQLGLFTFVLLLTGKICFESQSDCFVLRKKDHIFLQKKAFFTLLNSDQLQAATLLLITT